MGTVLERSRELEELCLNGDDDRRVADLLAPYDIRLRADWARRRRNRYVMRGVLRIGTLLVLDAVGLVGAYFAALLVRQNVLPDLVFRLAPLDLEPYMHLLPPAVAIQLLSLAAFRAYRPGRGRRDYYKVFLAILLGTLVLFFGETVYATWLPSRLLFVLAGATAVCSVVSLRWLMDRSLIAYRQGRELGRAALLLGREDQLPQIRSRFEQAPEINIRFVRSISFEEADAPSQLCAVTDQLSEVLLHNDVEVVVIAGDLPNGAAKSLFDRCLRAGCQVMLVPSVLREIPNPVQVEEVRGLFALVVMEPRLGLPQLAVKRAFDFIVSLAGLVALAPVVAVIALAVKLDSPGPVLFRQRRVGVGGRLFWMYKFRTMIQDAEGRRSDLEHLNQYGDARFFKVKNDPRITSVGRFLRSWSLDELPQLINVVRGEMSLVGPRPPVPEEVANYSEHHLQRLSVTPGITGLWQIKGRSDVLDFEEVVRLDLEYIRTWSVWRDLAILARTFPTVLKAKGAA